MSVWLMGQVWQADLDRPRKWVLMALADHADDEGYNCRPSEALVAWKTDYEPRHVKRILHDLVEIGVLEVVTEATPRRPKEYRIVMAAVPKKAPFRAAEAKRARGDEMSPLPQTGDGADVTPGVTQLGHPRGDTAMSPEPSIEPSENQRKTSEKETEDLWGKVLEQLADVVPEMTLNAFRRNLAIAERQGERIVLRASDDTVAGWTRDRFLREIEAAAARAFGADTTVELPKSETEERREQAAAVRRRRPPQRQRKGFLS